MTWRPDYIDLSALKSYLHVDDADDADDVEFGLWITAASRAVESRTNRQFGQETTAVTRTYRRPARFDAEACLWTIDIDDLMDTTGFTVNGVAYADSGAVLLPDNAPLDGVPYERLAFSTFQASPNVLVGRWGWNEVPSQVGAAVRLQCNRWNFRRDAPQGVAGSPDQGSEVRMLARLDPDVATSLIGLSRRRRAA